MKKPSVARRLRRTGDMGLAGDSLETVVCSKCGQRFAIHSESELQQAGLAERQAAWVSEQLVWDHIQERKHHGTMKLPELLQEEPASNSVLY